MPCNNVILYLTFNTLKTYFTYKIFFVKAANRGFICGKIQLCPQTTCLLSSCNCLSWRTSTSSSSPEVKRRAEPSRVNQPVLQWYRSWPSLYLSRPIRSLSFCNSPTTFGGMKHCRNKEWKIKISEMNTTQIGPLPVLTSHWLSFMQWSLTNLLPIYLIKCKILL